MEDLTTLTITSTNSDHLKNNNKSAVCDNNVNNGFKSLNKTSTCLQDVNAGHKRNLHTDFFTILLLVYHMVQWLKVTNTNGVS